MLFGLKNGPSTYQRVVNKAFHEHIDFFMKILLDDFTIFNSMDIHLDKLQLCFLKCHEFRISLNLDKCTFMVFSSLILGFVVTKEGNFHDPKNIQAILNMQILMNLAQIQVLNGMAQFYKCFFQNFGLFMEPIIKLMHRVCAL
jgi:hypothetical protein